jgi:leucyl-tRNA synthetase
LVEVATDCDKEAVVQAALADSKVKKFVGDSSYEAIYVPGKIVNIVLR